VITARIDVRADTNQVASAATDMFFHAAREAIRERGQFRVAMSGGSTPRRMYRIMAQSDERDEIDWSHVDVFWGDERFVPLDHDDSNFRMCYEELLRALPISRDRYHPVPTDLRPDDAAAAYERTLREVFDIGDEAVSEFDLILLGIGDDGHTASLFPGTVALNERERLVVANFVPQQNAMRITMTIPVLINARHVLVLVTGSNKADAVWRAIEGEENLNETPSQILREANGEVIWLLDRLAAAKLDGER
jgi:6-phosphogluconolactonase